MIKIVYNIVNWFINFIFKIEVVDEHNLPDNGSCLVCMNHISAWDPPVAVLSLKRSVRFLAKYELFKIPVVSWVLKMMNTIPLKRGVSDIVAFKTSIKMLKDGEVLGIFPTGTRERVCKDAPVRSGAALIAVKSGAPVVPVYIKANYRIFSKVQLIVGKPISFAQYADRHVSQSELASIANEIYSAILSLEDKN